MYSAASPDGTDALRVLVGDLRAELLFETHDQLDKVKRVRVQVVNERRFRLDFLFIDTELLEATIFLSRS